MRPGLERGRCPSPSAFLDALSGWIHSTAEIAESAEKTSLSPSNAPALTTRRLNLRFSFAAAVAVPAHVT